MSWRVPLFDLDYGEAEQEAVSRVIRSKWLTMGEVTQRFEEAFAESLGARHAIAVANCTAALHLSCQALGVGPGDEVILPALTFVATSNAVLYQGARPRFVDIESLSDFSISPNKVEEAISPDTVAIIVMHYGGYPCDMDAILSLARRRGLAVVEDAAHGPGALTNGRQVGTIGDLGCFSFFSNKNLAIGEGGMIVTDRDDLADRIRRLRSHAMTSLTWDRHQGRAHSYDVRELGYNYRLDELRSALGLVQLEKLKSNNERRRRVSAWYHDALSDIDSLSLPYRKHRGTTSAHIYPTLLEPGMKRRLLMQRLRDKGIQTSVHYPPIHLFEYYRRRELDDQADLPLTEHIGSHELTLPLFPGMRREQVGYVARAVRESCLEIKETQTSHGRCIASTPFADSRVG